jgi:hypothetical protein
LYKKEEAKTLYKCTKSTQKGATYSKTAKNVKDAETLLLLFSLCKRCKNLYTYKKSIQKGVISARNTKNAFFFY